MHSRLSVSNWILVAIAVFGRHLFTCKCWNVYILSYWYIWCNKRPYYCSMFWIMYSGLPVSSRIYHTDTITVSRWYLFYYRYGCL